MDYKSAIRHMLEKADLSMYRASLDMGHKPNHLGMLLRAHDIKLCTLQEISSLCGYRLTLTSADGTDSIVLDTGTGEYGTTRQDG